MKTINVNGRTYKLVRQRKRKPRRHSMRRKVVVSPWLRTLAIFIGVIGLVVAAAILVAVLASL